MHTTKDLVPFYTTLLEACSSSKNLQKLKQIHACAVTLGISHHDFIRIKLVSCYTSCARLYEANILFSFTNRRPTFLFNSLMKAYASQSLYSESLLIFRQMLLAYKRISHHTLPVVLKSCAGLFAKCAGQQVHGVIVVNGLSIDLANSNALITMYAKCGDLVGARKVFDTMSARNEVSWSAMIAGYGMHGAFGEVFVLFDRMLKSGQRPDGVTFTSVLAACSHGGLTDKGREYFEMMKEGFGLKPSLEHYTCVVDMLGRKGRLEEAADLISNMEIRPDRVLLRAFFGACKIHNKVEVAEKWQKIFMVEEMD